MFQNKDVVPLKTVPTEKALAVAFAAQRINSGKYVKHTRRFSEEENKTQFSNKELVKYYFKPEYRPDDFVPVEPKAEDYEMLSEANKWMKRYVMLGLDDNLDEFKKTMIECAVQQEVLYNNLGIIAYLPEFVKRDQHESGLKKEIRVEYRNSQHLGEEKDSVDCVVKILDKRYSTQWESYNYTAVTTEGNLVSFMNKFEQNVGDMKRVKAKVKSQTKNRLFDANETRLNYVKLYKV